MLMLRAIKLERKDLFEMVEDSASQPFSIPEEALEALINEGMAAVGVDHLKAAPQNIPRSALRLFGQ